MTRDEAHCRAIEAAESAWRRIVRGSGVEEAIDAYLAAMVLPISELPEDGLVYVMSQAERGIDAQGWIASTYGIHADRSIGLDAAKFFTFLPEPPK